MNRNQARRLAAFNAKKAAEKRLENRIGAILSGRASQAERATKLASITGSTSHEETTGACCLPQVAIFAAGHRKSKQITAR